MTDRSTLAAQFLHSAGWHAAARRHLAGDASDRRYERLTLAGRTAVLMDSPPGTGDDVSSFVQIDRHLLGLGLSAPQIMAQDLDHGFLLLEDLGDGLFARILQDQPQLEAQLYSAATDVLVRLQSAAAPQGLLHLGAEDWARAAGFALDWYRWAIVGDSGDPAPFHAALTEALSRHADDQPVLILRDYHAENLLWLPDRQGLARAGLLDFQLGQMGQPGYDLVSLLQDARRDVSHETEGAMIRRFLHTTGRDHSSFAPSYAVLGAQRSLRIMGVFVRLCLASAKPSYVALIPRVWAQLQRNLLAPALQDLARLCDRLLPPPTDENLEKIKNQCGRPPSP